MMCGRRGSGDGPSSIPQVRASPGAPTRGQGYKCCSAVCPERKEIQCTSCSPCLTQPSQVPAHAWCSGPEACHRLVTLLWSLWLGPPLASPVHVLDPGHAEIRNTPKVGSPSLGFKSTLYCSVTSHRSPEWKPALVFLPTWGQQMVAVVIPYLSL
jgi:hypothetical protein